MAVGCNSRTPINRYGVTKLTLRHQAFHNIGNLANRHRMFYRPLPLETAMFQHIFDSAGNPLAGFDPAG